MGRSLSDLFLFPAEAVPGEGPTLPMVPRIPRACPHRTPVRPVGIRHHAGARSPADLATRAHQDQRSPQVTQAARGAASHTRCQKARPGLPWSHAGHPAQWPTIPSVLATRRRLRPQHADGARNARETRVHSPQPSPKETCRPPRRLAVVKRPRVAIQRQRTPQDRQGVLPRTSTDQTMGILISINRSAWAPWCHASGRFSRKHVPSAIWVRRGQGTPATSWEHASANNRGSMALRNAPDPWRRRGPEPPQPCHRPAR